MTALALPPTSPLTVFPTIDLATLVAEAAMLTRIDRKYVLTTADLHTVLGGLRAASGNVRVLEIEGQTIFGYRSTYLDTPSLDAFRLTGQRRRRRFKVRSRSYLDTGTTWLEVKTRGARGTTVKQRIEHPELGHGLTGPGRAFVHHTLRGADIHGVDVTTLEATMVSEYRRSTLHVTGPAGASRATIDTDLVWRSTGRLAGSRWQPGDLAIIETKGGSTPSAIDRVLWSHGHRPRIFSKYGTGLTVLMQELPSLKWHRTITHDLTGLVPAA